MKPSTLAAKLANKEVTSAPLIDQVAVDVLIEHSNADIPTVADDQTVQLMKQFSPDAGKNMNKYDCVIFERYLKVFVSEENLYLDRLFHNLLHSDPVCL